MKLGLSLAILTAAALAGPLHAQDTPALKDQRSKVSYGAGLNLGNTWKRQEIDLDLELVLRGMKDALTGGKALMTEQEVRDVMTAYQNELRNKQAEKRRIVGDKNKEEGAKFLAENRTKPGVFTLESGLQCKVLKEGTGPMPTTNDTVFVNYRGTLIDGTEFDSSYSRGQPAEFGVTRVVRGWTEALQRMKVGSKWQVFIPSDLAYGERGAGEKIGPNATLIFEMELLSIKPPVAPPPPVVSQPVTSDIIKVPSAEELKKGAKIEIIKPDQIEKK